MLAINTNIPSQGAQRGHAGTLGTLATSVERLSSGLRINHASDDAAGLAISERLAAQVTGLNRAARNASDASSLLQVADGALGKIVGNFQRIRELAVQAANPTNSDSDRAALQIEADALVAANIDFADQATFNKVALLDGSFASQFQIGANGQDRLDLAIPPALIPRTATLGLVTVPLRQVDLTVPVSGALSTGALTINNQAIGATVAGAQPGQSSASAFAVAAAINAAAVADVGASADTTINGTVAALANIPNGGLTVNGVALGPIAGASAAAVAASAAAAFTAAAGASGVTASASGGVLTLNAADGRDIVLAESGGGYAAALGLATGATRGTLHFFTTPLPNGGAVIGGSNPGAAGLSAGRQPQVATGGTVDILQPLGSSGEPRIDLGSALGANDALDYLDAKIDSSNAIRSLLGATQKRLEAVYAGILDSATNLAAARARIRDTDYAAESAHFTRGQILQAAGIAVIAQANALPKQALRLLR